MTRAELIRLFVLNECCDDYEDIQQITKWTVEWASKCGLTVSHDDIIQALRELVEMAFMKAWDLTRWADPTTSEHPGEDITPLNPRFARTEAGLVLLKASSGRGPFDEDHNLRESWLAAEASRRHEELVRLFILGSYGNCTHIHLASIEMNWDRLGGRYGITISRGEFIQALRELVGLGYLQASYRDECWQYEGMPPLDDIKPFGAYFWVTGAGWDFQNANSSWWPFDEDSDGEFTLRRDWVLPET
jgi:hypothetical protein